MPERRPPSLRRTVGRYLLGEQIAFGGMASVHLGRLEGGAGFSRLVAVKRLHPQYASTPDVEAMLLDEARLAARTRHPNVVPILDVVSHEGELVLVMEYVHGEALSKLLRAARARGAHVPAPVASAIVSGLLHGLHAAHEARDERGRPLDIVHRDVSPQNVLVGADGLARVADFGIAKAAGRLQSTRDGQLEGKLGYMAPEQFLTSEIDRRVDIWAAGVVLWECVAGERLHDGDQPGLVMNAILQGSAAPCSSPSRPRARRRTSGLLSTARTRGGRRRRRREPCCGFPRRAGPRPWRSRTKETPRGSRRTPRASTGSRPRASA
jgi:serine/threonine-protein kinase